MQAFASRQPSNRSLVSKRSGSGGGGSGEARMEPYSYGNTSGGSLGGSSNGSAAAGQHQRGKASVSSVGSGTARHNYGQTPYNYPYGPSSPLRSAQQRSGSDEASRSAYVTGSSGQFMMPSSAAPNAYSSNDPAFAQHQHQHQFNYPGTSSHNASSVSNAGHRTKNSENIAHSSGGGIVAMGANAVGVGSANYGAPSGASQNLRAQRPRRPDTEEIKHVATVHYEELLRFLKSHLAKGQRGPRTNAREKLTRLSQQQFTELSTDVYDELMRRITNARTGSDIPHLAVREEFHPKRNQARQKLATLPRTRFKDLSSDVFFELERRFPQLRDEFRPEVSERERREEQEAAQTQRQRQNSILSNRDDEADLPKSAFDTTGVTDQGTDEILPQPSNSDVVVPQKSTLVEEEISVPFTSSNGESNRESSSLIQQTNAQSSEERATDIRDSVVTNDQDNRNTMYSQASSLGTGFFNGYAGSRATESVASPNIGAGDGFQNLEIEKVRSDYEFRIATLQQKMSALDSRNAALIKEHNGQLTELQEENDRLQREHEAQTIALQKEMMGVREKHEGSSRDLADAHERLKDLQDRHVALQEERSAPTVDAELTQELEALRREHSEQEEIVLELRGEVANLIEELRQLSARNDEILSEKENDQTIIKDLNNQVASYRRKYENSRMELRNLKAISQLYVQPPKTDELMPPSDTGIIADVNLTAFQSSVDDLLAAARSKTPSNVLMSMKTVVLAATLITDDVNKAERDVKSANEALEAKEKIMNIKSRISATLNNLMTACRNHASSHGLSPVSLLDAAASHVSTAIIDLVKVVKVRKASEEEAQEFEATFTHNGTLPNGLKPLIGSSHLPSPGGTGERLLNTQSHSSDAGNSPHAQGTSRAFSPRIRQGSTPIGRYSPVTYRADISRKGSGAEGSWKTKEQRSRNASISSSSSQVQQTATDRTMPIVPALGSHADHVASNLSSISSVTPRSPLFQNSFEGALPQSKSSAESGLQASLDEDLLGAPSLATLSDAVEADVDNTSAKVVSLPRPSSRSAISPMLQTPPPPVPPADDSEDEQYWAELRNYIEVQTEAIVHCIQALLSSIREGAQGNQLHENLTQITTIVSSIIAISKDNIPKAAAAAAVKAGSSGQAATASSEGERILRDLSEHCERLFEMQTNGGQFDKTTKSNMASASYGVAKGLKALNSLLNLDE